MSKRPLTDNLPDYETAQRFLRILAGTRYSDYVGMMSDINAQIGNPKSPVNWKNPDDWIPQRLRGESRKLASRLWTDSDNLVNPRHSKDLRALSGHHALAVYSDDFVALTEKGERFSDGDDEVVRAIDAHEGVLFILSEVMSKGPCKRLDLIDSFTRFCHKQTTWEAHSSIDSALSARFRHLRQRKLIERTGHKYQVSAIGLRYLQRDQRREDLGRRYELEIHRLVNENNSEAKRRLAERLAKMNPYQFEHLIKRMLEAMDYENVVVTSPAKDKGVDVVGEIELGITRVREVIQVKRQQSNVGQPIVSQLRGSLPLFGADMGSIITTGGFTKQAKEIAIVPSGTPITLIDGEKLLDLLIENNIGIRKSQVEKWEFNEEQLREFEDEVGFKPQQTRKER